MSIFRPMWLLKRNGPILTGIALDGNRDNTTYRVIVHVHNLLVPTGFVSLTLWSPLQNRRGTYHESLTLRRHSLEFLDACNRLREPVTGIAYPESGSKTDYFRIRKIYR